MIARLTLIAKENIFFKNFSVLTFSSVLTQFLTMIIGIKIARTLSPYNFGVYNLLQLHVTIFTVVASLGIRRIIVRNIARDKTDIQNLLRNSLLLRLYGMLLAVVIFSIYYYFYNSYQLVFFGLVIISMLMMVSFDYFDSLAFGLEKMEFSGFVNLLSTVCWLLGILLVPKENLSLILIFIIFTIFNSLKALLFLIVIKFRTGYSTTLGAPVSGGNSAQNLVKESLPFYYLDLFTLLSMQIPLLFLEYRSGTEQIGYFNIASKVLLPINLIVTTALSAIFPILARLYTTNYSRFINVIKSMFIAISLFGIMGAFTATLFRKEIILLLYGAKYLESNLVLLYQCWFVAFFSIVCLIGTILGAIEKQRQLSYLSLICTTIQVPLLWYGAQYGAQYLSAAFLLATVINLFLHFFAMKKFVESRISFFFYLKIMLFMGVGYLVSLQIPTDIYLGYKVVGMMVLTTITTVFLYRQYSDQIKTFFAKQT